MKVSEVMQGVTPNADFKGSAVHNNMVLAINVAGTSESTQYANYAVLQVQLESTEASLNPETSEKTYIRSGTASSKTGNQRTFSITGERYHGDEAQDFLLSHEMKFATGQKAVVEYIYFSMLTGKGEKGTCVVLVNNDGGGDASGGLEIDIELRQNGAAPTEYTYSAS